MSTPLLTTELYVPPARPERVRGMIDNGDA